MKDKIIVVGGYGQVGRVVAEALAERYPGQVFAAGRRLEEARAFSEGTGRKVLPLKIDFLLPEESFQHLAEARVIVMCAESGDESFARTCIEAKTHYVDVSATYEYIRKVEALRDLAAEQDVAVVMNVGLAPGLTNLLARFVTERLEEVERIDIDILLGLGEAHGLHGMQWTLERVGREFSVMTAQGPVLVTGFTDPKQTDFPGPYGRRTTYRFDFSDQHVLPRTLGVAEVSTRMCFDSGRMTSLFAMLSRTRLARVTKWLGARRVNAASGLFRMGTEDCIARAEAFGRKGKRPSSVSAVIAGEREVRATGLVAGYVATRAYEESLPAGLFHIEQVCEPLPVFEHLGPYGYRFEFSDSAG